MDSKTNHSTSTLLNTLIEYLTKYERLGKTAGLKFNWKEHIQNLKPKLRKILIILKRMKDRISNNDLQKLAVGIFFSKIQYGITMYRTTKLKHQDPLPRNTKSLQVMSNKVLRLIKPEKSPIREGGAENLCSYFNFLSINQMIIKFKLLEFWKSLNVETYPLHDRINYILNKTFSNHK